MRYLSNVIIMSISRELGAISSRQFPMVGNKLFQKNYTPVNFVLIQTSNNVFTVNVDSFKRKARLTPTEV